MKRAKKNFIGKVFAPTGTKDYSTYITKIRQSGADACYLVLAGDDNNAFLAQAQQYQLPVQGRDADGDRSSLRRCVPSAMPRVGLVGSSRYAFTIDNPAEQGVRRAVEEGAQRRAPRHLRGRDVAGHAGDPAAGIEKAKGTDTRPLRAALKTVELDSIKGKIKMRECDHQAVQQGFMVKVVKKEGFSHPIPEVIATYPGRAHHAGLQEDDLRRLMILSSTARCGPRVRGQAGRPIPIAPRPRSSGGP